jgi:hypothetical protein
MAHWRIAYEAARIMEEQGVSDFEHARRKAAERTGILNRRSWPSNEMIQEALLTQRRLFSSASQTRDLQRLRETALQAMQTFRSFNPRLIGPVLQGSGHPDQGVQICLYAECAEEVVFTLIDRRIPWQEGERMFRYGGGDRRIYPTLRFVAGQTPIELIIRPPQALRHPPLDPVTERPERGADITELERLLVRTGDRPSSHCSR